MTEPGGPRLDRRALLRLGLVGGAAATVGALAGEALPRRQRAAAASGVSDIQHDINGLLGPAVRRDGTAFRPVPAYTYFVTATLTRTPTVADQRALAEALALIEGTHEPGPDGVMAVVGYGTPYLDRLPAALVAEQLPRRAADGRPVFAEAEPAPTDLLPGHDTPRKRNLRVPVAIEANDLALTLRSDRLPVLLDTLAWLDGEERLGGRRTARPDLSALRITSRRLMFFGPGLPRRVADTHKLPYAERVAPESPMWMGFADSQASGSGPPEITTFAGHPSARLTTAKPGDYLDRGSVQHLSHTLLDLVQFYLGDGSPDDNIRESYRVRLEYMFRANPAPADSYADGLSGPVFLPNEFRGADDAEKSAQGLGTNQGVHRVGHLSAMQRSSRAPDGTPLHIRADGPGFDDIDSPDGARYPKLHFSIFVPTADTFAEMRRKGAAQDLAKRHNVAEKDNGLERFLTTTRRQNFLVPPRRHRAYPLLELA